MFNGEDKPFVGLIISPYAKFVNSNPQITVFHNKKNHPYSLKFKFLPTKKLPKSLYKEIVQLALDTQQGAALGIDLKSTWNADCTKGQKISRSLEILIKRNEMNLDKLEGIENEILGEDSKDRLSRSSGHDFSMVKKETANRFLKKMKAKLGGITS